MCSPDTIESPDFVHDEEAAPGSVEAVADDAKEQVSLDDTSPNDEIESQTPENKDVADSTCVQRGRKKLVKFFNDYEFLIMIILAIIAAKAYPPLGADYLAPEVTAAWIAVIFIFLMAGLELKTDEFKDALKEVYFNVFVQMFNFGFVSSLGFGFSRVLIETGALVHSLADGMAICACLPMAINMVLLLTKTSGGDEAAAIFNAAFSNMVGVFLSPLLILGYLGITGDVDLPTVFYKLVVRVVVPLIVGQIIQKTSKQVLRLMKKYRKTIKKLQIYALVFIVYTVFCETFSSGNDVGLGNIFVMLMFQLMLLLLVSLVAWYSMKLLFPDKPRLRAMGIFGCVQKTVSVGVPLIGAMYEGNPNVGLYTLPLLIWHPMQLVLGSILAPRLQRFVDREKKRLGIVDEDDDLEHGTTKKDLRQSDLTEATHQGTREFKEKAVGDKP